MRVADIEGHNTDDPESPAPAPAAAAAADAGHDADHDDQQYRSDPKLRTERM